MTPTFLYDPQQHCLREVARLREPVKDIFKSPRGYELAVRAYRLHLASLRVIPCASDTKWPEGELEEQIDFKWGVGPLNGFVLPITQPRLYTQAEAEEIWDGGWNAAIYYSIHDEENITKQQYFKTRFNEDINK